MVVFDVDGTLISGEAADWSSLDGALREVGFTPAPDFFAALLEVTGQAIVHTAFADRPLEERKQREHLVVEGYLRRLKAAHAVNPKCFAPANGAVALLQELRRSGVPIAIATGDWRESISFKLHAAGIPFESIPMVTSSEHYSRADIIAAAVKKAGCRLEDALYVGDGLWDMRACAKLGIPFIGVGRRREKLRDAGAIHTLLDLMPTEFIAVRSRITATAAR